MLSLDLLDKVAKRLDFHSTAIIFLDFFDKDQTSLNITRLHSTHSTRWPNGSIFSSIFCRVKNRVKNRVVWPGPYNLLFQNRGHQPLALGSNLDPATTQSSPSAYGKCARIHKMICYIARHCCSSYILQFL